MNELLGSVVGKVTDAERDEIKRLFERKNGLAELFKTLINIKENDLDANGIYEKLVHDMGKTTAEFKKWWDEKSLKYSWQKDPEGFWEIDFETGEIYLKRVER